MIATSARLFQAYAEPALSNAPVRRIWFREMPAVEPLEPYRHSWVDRIDCMLIARFREVDVSNSLLGNDGLQRLLIAMDNYLRWFNVANTGISEAGAAFIAAAPQLANLCELDISDNWVGTRGARLIVESPCLANLKELHAHRIEIDHSSKTADMLRQRFGDGLDW